MRVLSDIPTENTSDLLCVPMSAKCRQKKRAKTQIKSIESGFWGSTKLLITRREGAERVRGTVFSLITE